MYKETKKRKRGVITQTMMSFRIDDENAKWLDEEAARSGSTKGRILNNMMQAAAEDNEDRPPKTLEAVKKTLIKALALVMELMDTPQPPAMTEGERPATREERADEEGYCQHCRNND